MRAHKRAHAVEYDRSDRIIDLLLTPTVWQANAGACLLTASADELLKVQINPELINGDGEITMTSESAVRIYIGELAILANALETRTSLMQTLILSDLDSS